MTDDVFEKLQFANILILLDILRDSQEGQLSYIKRGFSERAEGFIETATCIQRIGMGKQVNGTFQLCVNWTARNKEKRREIVLQHLLKGRNRYGSAILRFVRKFSVEDGDIVYFSSIQDRDSESAVRNFLMEMKVVKYITQFQKYLLELEYVTLYTYARDRAKYMSPYTLSMNVSAKSDIGLAAERKVFSYEQNRVGLPFSKKIRHVSQQNVAAGYDIRSFTLINNGEIAPRFIEVKAVPSPSCRFYWSQNEISTARSLNDWYYLYLLPFNKRGEFDLNKLKVINSPYNALMADKTVWACETNTLVCYRKLP